MRTLPAVLALSVGLILACKGKDDDGTDSPTDDSGAVVESEAPLTAEDMPADPSPISITFSGSINTTLTFDRPSCSNPVGSSNLRVFWRGSHPTVLRMDILGDFTGAGTYSNGQHNVNVVLQDEAGGQGWYYPIGEGTVDVEVLYHDDDVAWGSYTVSGFNATEGTLTLDPSTIPIWCPEFT